MHINLHMMIRIKPMNRFKEDIRKGLFILGIGSVAYENR